MGRNAGGADGRGFAAVREVEEKGGWQVTEFESGVG